MFAASLLALTLLAADAPDASKAPKASKASETSTASASASPSAPAPAPAPAPAKKATAATRQLPFAPVLSKNYLKDVVAPHKGRPVLVNFWASYCLPCLEEIPALQALQAQYAGKADIVFINFEAAGDTDHILKVLQRRKITIISRQVADTDPEAFIDVVDPGWHGEMPFTVVYDATGAVSKRMVGGQTAELFAAALTDAIAKKAP